MNVDELLKVIGKANNARFNEAMSNIKKYIAGLKKVKIFVADSRSFGHQSSSINILFNLIRLGATATFTVVYEKRDVLEKIKVLLPINPAEIAPITLPAPDGGKVTVNFISSSADQPECDLVITGGYDSTVDNLASLNGKYSIELQPFNWVEGDSQNAIYEASTKKVYSLDDAIKDFNSHAFYIENPVKNESFWAEFATTLPSSWTTRVALVKKILNLYDSVESYLCPVYGINTGMIDPILSLFNMCCGISYLQDQTKFAAQQKAVIVSFSPVNQAGQDNDVDLDTLKSLIADIKYPGKGQLYQPNNICHQYVTSSRLKDRVKYYSGEKPQELEKLFNNLKNNEILVVQVGPVPAPLFNYTYFKANLPFVFEGQNTATLALNFGKPYIHITTPGGYIGENLYPLLPPDIKSNLPNGRVATMISSKMGDYPGNWKSPTVRLTKEAINTSDKPGLVQQSSPAYGLGKYAVETLQNSNDSNMLKYFARFGEYFHNEKNDKLILALIYLHQNIILKKDK